MTHHDILVLGNSVTEHKLWVNVSAHTKEEKGYLLWNLRSHLLNGAPTAGTNHLQEVKPYWKFGTHNFKWWVWKIISLLGVWIDKKSRSQAHLKITSCGTIGG